jgi:hypothetical protein
MILNKAVMAGGVAAVILGGTCPATAQELVDQREVWEQRIEIARGGIHEAGRIHDADQGVKAAFFAAREADVLEVEPLTPRAGVRNAPFTAEAVTEFTQILGDGNRIERTFSTMIARDSRGRTRREQEVAMVGPLAALQDSSPKLVIIIDPEAKTDYTLDDHAKVATKHGGPFQIRGQVKGAVGGDVLMVMGSDGAPGIPAIAKKGVGPVPVRPDVIETMVTKGVGRGVVYQASTAAAKVSTEPLGTKMIEGVAADGVRTTMTIPAGAVGNVSPIDVVTERWTSKELQMDVLITRRDPRAGDTTYRLTNIVRAEPPADLFVVPADYTVHEPADPATPARMMKKIDVKGFEIKKLGK